MASTTKTTRHLTRKLLKYAYPLFSKIIAITLQEATRKITGKMEMGEACTYILSCVLRKLNEWSRPLYPPTSVALATRANIAGQSRRDYCQAFPVKSLFSVRALIINAIPNRAKDSSCPRCTKENKHLCHSRYPVICTLPTYCR